MFTEYINFVPLLAPADVAGSAVATRWMSLKSVLNAAILLVLGNLAGANPATVTLEAATAAASGGESAVAFDYRVSSAVGSGNTWGDRASATSAGLSVAMTDDSKLIEIIIDPAAIQALKTDAAFVRAVVTPGGSGTATVVGAVGLAEPSVQGLDMEELT